MCVSGVSAHWEAMRIDSNLVSFWVLHNRGSFKKKKKRVNFSSLLKPFTQESWSSCHGERVLPGLGMHSIL